jgi:L-ascorbate metabolism protein UlaG (beta-lactamase superfamily)
MSVKLTWLSHGSWLIESQEYRILLDPFLTDNPAATATAESIATVSHVLVSHAHFDHIADVASLVNRDSATLVGGFEVVLWFQQKHSVKNAVMMNTGGSCELPWGRLQMVPAVHSSSFPDGSYGGVAAGYLLTIAGKRIYFACDTALFGDMRLYAHGVDVAVLPIGDLFTMGIRDSIEAVKLIEPKHVLPAHYGTWPPIATDAQEWARCVKDETATKPVVLAIGECFTVT